MPRRASGLAHPALPGLVNPAESVADVERYSSFCPGNSQQEQPMSFNLTSQSFHDGDYLPEAHILSKDFGFGCAGGNQSTHLSWSDPMGLFKR